MDMESVTKVACKGKESKDKRGEKSCRGEELWSSA
jgi:hypothetical protein